MATIVCVDDDPSILELVKINLEMQGHNVITAPDGETGYALVQQHQPQLVILDVMMPGVDGYTVCQRIRKNPAISSVPGSGVGEEEPEKIGVEKSTVQFWHTLSPLLVASIQSAATSIDDLNPHGPMPFVPTLKTVPTGVTPGC